MKKISKVIITALLLTSISATAASASEEGEATYAVVDASGVVTNVIVCQASVCGPSGSLNGSMPDGQKLVLQVPAHPVTGKNQGSFIGTSENPVTYDVEKQVFSQGSSSFPIPVIKSETIDTATITATINSNQVTFGPNNFQDGKMNFDPKVDANTSATLSATEGSVKEIAIFDTPKTRAQIQAAIENKLLIIQRYLNRFYTLLNGWILD